METSGSVTFNHLGAADKLVMRTRNNEYVFVVVDPVRRLGVLSGGLLGERPREAVLVGAMREDGSGLNGDPSGLRTQSQALFYIEAKVGVERFITSTITRLAHLPSDHGKRRAA